MRRRERRARRERDRLVPLEKSRRVIRLEKRRQSISSHPVAAWICGIWGILCILYCAAIAIVGHGTYFFLVWGGIGVACLGFSALLGNDRAVERIPRWIKKTFITLLCLGLLLLCAVVGLIFTEYRAQAEPGADYCIVLGAQWKESGPSEVLRRRLDRAIAYLRDNPDTKVIVSGGRGENEPMAEAAGMREYLLLAGIAEERILVEAQSSNTYENLVFSGQLLDREEDRVVLVTTNFHVFRAKGIARKQGYANVEGLAADSVLGMEPNNLLREFMGVLKDFLVGNL